MLPSTNMFSKLFEESSALKNRGFSFGKPQFCSAREATEFYWDDHPIPSKSDIFSTW